MLQSFLPPRRRGIILHSVLAVFLAAVSAGSLVLGLQQQVGSYFVFLLVISVVLAPPVIWLTYRGYALSQSEYSLERDGLRIHWGLRSEDIPLPKIEWVRPAAELGFHLPLPLLWLPGGILGTRTIEGLGPVEFIASERRTMLLIATPEKVFVISPADANGFMRAFQRAMEMGSPTPLVSHSAVPAAFLQRVWSDWAARWLIAAGLVFCTALFVYVSMAVPTLSRISLGFDRLGHPVEFGPPERLLLLPVLAIFAYAVDLSAGLFFYRRFGDRPISYMLWAGSALTPILLIVAALFLASAAA
jgi:hypothetical protein